MPLGSSIEDEDDFFGEVRLNGMLRMALLWNMDLLGVFIGEINGELANGDTILLPKRGGVFQRRKNDSACSRVIGPANALTLKSTFRCSLSSALSCKICANKIIIKYGLLCFSTNTYDYNNRYTSNDSESNVR